MHTVGDHGVRADRNRAEVIDVDVLADEGKVTQGQQLLEPQIRYLFYLSNLPSSSHSA